MSSEHDTRRRRRNPDEEMDEAENSRNRPLVDPDERDEYAEWRRERGRRGRKRKDKAGGRHRQRRQIDDY